MLLKQHVKIVDILGTAIAIGKDIENEKYNKLVNIKVKKAEGVNSNETDESNYRHFDLRTHHGHCGGGLCT
jgi:hypothetical protein